MTNHQTRRSEETSHNIEIAGDDDDEGGWQIVGR